VREGVAKKERRRVTTEKKRRVERTIHLHALNLLNQGREELHQKMFDISTAARKKKGMLVKAYSLKGGNLKVG